MLYVAHVRRLTLRISRWMMFQMIFRDFLFIGIGKPKVGVKFPEWRCACRRSGLPFVGVDHRSSSTNFSSMRMPTDPGVTAPC